MEAQEPDLSHVFRELADILELFEETGSDFTITHATPNDQNLLDTNTFSVEVGARIPFLSHELPPSRDDMEIKLTPTEASLRSDGSLHIEMKITAGYEDELAPEDVSASATDIDIDSESVSLDGASDADSSSSDGDANPKPTATTETDNTDEKRTHTRSTGALRDASTEPENGTQQDETTPDQRERTDEDPGSDAENPPYRDPERLQEVYEEYDTFDEMTDALDVDVTSQTVRRYMIKHDIHTPASETGSHAAETLLNMDPDVITPQKTDSETHSDEDHGRTHPNSRKTPLFKRL
ncbi:hypothetical protein [Halorussus salinisoli]|uniref:hypothetical protein n=1 Tax=Halorussus salinisoli TaxID=2558242 RepID=UPI0010C176DD|nr:hypothetical protein [Halorussus salinisoli]